MTFAQNHRTWMVHSPLRYPGSKVFLYSTLSEMVKVDTFVEPYAGSAVLSLNFSRAGKKVIINDLDKGIFALWFSVYAYGEDLAQMIEKCEINLKQYQECVRVFKGESEAIDLVSLGFATLYINRTNFSGMMGAKVIGGESQDGKYGMATRFNQKNIAARIRRAWRLLNPYDKHTEVYNQDGMDLIKHPGFLYCDPPYLHIDPRIYRHNFDEEKMLELVRGLRDRKGPWLLSHSPNKLIDNELEDFYQAEIAHRYGIKTFEAQMNTEKVWSNVPIPRQTKLVVE